MTTLPEMKIELLSPAFAVELLGKFEIVPGRDVALPIPGAPVPGAVPTGDTGFGALCAPSSVAIRPIPGSSFVPFSFIFLAVN